MDQQQIFFTNAKQKHIFELLTNQIAFESRYYTSDDFKVDLVMRLQVPQIAKMSKYHNASFSQLFFNTPIQYQRAFHKARDYLELSAYKEQSNIYAKQFKIKCMVSLQKYTKSFYKNKIFINSDLQEEQIQFQCDHEYSPQFDMFTLRYNMIMIILQHNCGLRVKTFLLQENKKKAIYFLISQKTQNLLKLANKYKIKKQINMTYIDFNVNDPVDKSQRPLKYNSILKQSKFFPFLHQQLKTFSRHIHIKNNNFNKQIINESYLSQAQINKYSNYLDNYLQLLDEIRIKDFKITSNQKQYIFKYNNNKITKGSCDYIQKMKKRQFLFQEIKKLNKKYQYNIYQYQNSFFQFCTPNSHNYFQKLMHIMKYKYYPVNQQGQLELFTNMERIKLTYLCIEEFFKVQNLAKINISIFAINDNYQKFGKNSYQMNQGKDFKFKQKKYKIKKLTQEWHGLIPCLTNIRSVRDYMGQNYAYELMVKIYLINFFFIMTPIGILVHFIGKSFVNNQYDIYDQLFAFAYLTLIIIALTIFQERFKSQQSTFYQNYSEQTPHTDFREQYKGPLVRNPLDDNANHTMETIDLRSRIIQLASFIGLGIILVIQAIFFYYLRKSIVYTYGKFPILDLYYISLPHLIFYAIFFWSNYLILNTIFTKIIVFFVQFQNLPTIKLHEDMVQWYKRIFFFGIELIGPSFFYIIEPFQNTSCYSLQCAFEVQHYIYSRYLIIFSFFFIKIAYIVFYYFRVGLKEIKALIQTKQNQYVCLTFEEKLNELIKHVQRQYEKQEIYIDFKDQALSLYYFCIYSIYVTFCSTLGFGLLILDYILVRLQILRNGRRPIPSSFNMRKVSLTFSGIIHTCIIVNSYAIIVVFQSIQYDLSFTIQYFKFEQTKNDLMTLKILAVLFLIIFFQIIYVLIKELISYIEYNSLEDRMRNMYKYFMLGFNKYEKDMKKYAVNQFPLKTIFRTFTLEQILVQKRKQIKNQKGYEKLSVKSLYNKNKNQINQQVLLNIFKLGKLKHDNKQDEYQNQQNSNNRFKDMFMLDVLNVKQDISDYHEQSQNSIVFKLKKQC